MSETRKSMVQEVNRVMTDFEARAKEQKIYLLADMQTSGINRMGEKYPEALASLLEYAQAECMRMCEGKEKVIRARSKCMQNRQMLRIEFSSFNCEERSADREEIRWIDPFLRNLGGYYRILQKEDSTEIRLAVPVK